MSEDDGDPFATTVEPDSTTNSCGGVVNTVSQENGLQVPVKIWVPAWISGSWLEGTISIDSSGLIRFENANENDTAMHEIGTTPCCRFSSIVGGWQPSTTTLQLTTALDEVLLLDTATPQTCDQLMAFINKIVEKKRFRRFGPVRPVRPDQQPKRPSITEKIAHILPAKLAGLIAPQNQRPTVPPKPAFLRRGNRQPLELDTKSKLWNTLKTLRSDLSFIPGNLASLLEAIRVGVQLRRTPSTASSSIPNIPAPVPNRRNRLSTEQAAIAAELLSKARSKLKPRIKSKSLKDRLSPTHHGGGGGGCK